MLAPFEEHEREPLSERPIHDLASEVARICNCDVGLVLDAGGRYLQETYHSEED